ncbi:hypothetical protein CMI42_05550 [Candidatus Pacearchaeota archaeon]|nr:hypothetical protein [Candidatus Pacearchaeota archaeon]|tara:strand:- start:444 stop:923 length:480 start_codon:yes stop_codon:yes gene_type:complete
MVKEESVLKIRPSRKVYIPYYLMVIFLLGVIIYVKYTERQLNDTAFWLVVIFSVGAIILTEIHRLGNSYEINERSVLHRNGYFTIVTKRTEFGSISDVDIKQNLWQRLFSYGHVHIFKFSEENPVHNIDNPHKFADFLERQISRTWASSGDESEKLNKD